MPDVEDVLARIRARKERSGTNLGADYIVELIHEGRRDLDR